MNKSKTFVKPVRVLQVGMSPNIGGVETYLMEQFRHLDRSKVIYDFVNNTCDLGEIAFSDEIIKSGSKIYNIPSRRSNPIRHYWQWIKLLHKIAYDYVAIVHNINSMSYVYPIFLSRFFNIPIRISHSHNSFTSNLDYIRKNVCKINRKLLSWSATDYFACSKMAGDWMFGTNTKYKIIPNSIVPSRFVYDLNKRIYIRRQLNIKNELVIGHVGRFAYQKNQLFLIDIFKEIHKRNKNSLLLLIGAGDNKSDSYLSQVERKVNDYGLNQSVRFLGLRNDVPNLMQAIDCFVLPSHYEGFPIVGIEAQASGIPCYFSDTITQEIKLTELAHYISLAQSPIKWAECILKVNPQKRRKMENEIRQAGYDIDESIKKLEEYYMAGKSYLIY